MKKRISQINKEKRKLLKDFHEKTKVFLIGYFNDKIKYKNTNSFFGFKVKIPEVSHNNNKYNIFFETIDVNEPLLRRYFDRDVFSRYNEQKIIIDNITINHLNQDEQTLLYLDKLKKFETVFAEFLQIICFDDLKNQMCNLIDEQKDYMIEYYLNKDYGLSRDSFLEIYEKYKFLNNNLYCHYTNWYRNKVSFCVFKIEKDAVTIETLNIEGQKWETEKINTININDFFDFSCRDNILRYINDLKYHFGICERTREAHTKFIDWFLEKNGHFEVVSRHTNLHYDKYPEHKITLSNETSCRDGMFLIKDFYVIDEQDVKTILSLRFDVLIETKLYYLKNVLNIPFSDYYFSGVFPYYYQNEIVSNKEHDIATNIIKHEK